MLKALLWTNLFNSVSVDQKQVKERVLEKVLLEQEEEYTYAASSSSELEGV